MYTPLSRRVSTWLNASEIAGTCGITEVNETSHQRLLCKQLQTARLGTRCDPLPWAVFACLLAVGYYLSLSAHRDGWEGRVAGAGAPRWAESRLGVARCWTQGVCQPCLKHRVLSLAAGRSIVWAPPRAGKHVLRRLKCADPEYGSNPLAPGCCCDSDDKPCLWAEHRNSDVAARCRVSTSFVTELVCWYGAVITAVDIVVPFGACRMHPILCWYLPWPF